MKDNIQATDMPTTGGAWAFRAFVPPYDATLVTRLKAAGAQIIAKTALTELVGAVTDQMPANYSAVGGHAYNPYDPRPDPRLGRIDTAGPSQTAGGPNMLLRFRSERGRRAVGAHVGPR